MILLAGDQAEPSPSPPVFRYPIAASWLQPGKLLAVTNSRSGTVSLVDLSTGLVRQDLPVGKQLSSSAVTKQGKLLLTTDQAAHELVAITSDEGGLRIAARVSVARYPVSVAVSPTGETCFVAGLWSRQLDVIQIEQETSGVSLRIRHSLAIPFAPRAILLLPDGEHLVVTAAFGGQLALVNVVTGKVISQRAFQAHNIVRLAWNDQERQLLVPHQILLETAPIDVDNIQWGALMKNVVRVIDLRQLLDPQVNLTTATRVISIGSEGDGHGDPTAALPLSGGDTLVASGGTNRVLRLNSLGTVVNSLNVGARPVQLLSDPAERQAIVINEFDDSLSIIDLASFKVQATFSLGKQPPLTPAIRGERLFYDASLSYDGWMSCHSCHTDGHTNNLLADTRGDGNFGAPKRTLSLLGVRDTDRWAWNGEIKDLQQQVRKSIESTLHGTASAEAVFDLTNYLHTLDAPPPSQPLTANATDREQWEQGRKLFLARRCDQCHVPTLTYTSHDAYDVGLEDEHGQRKFNPPSLRGVGHGTKFFHDQRATSLEDVFQVHGHQINDPLNDQQMRDLLRFLRSL